MVCMLVYGATDGAIPFLVRTVMNDIFVRKDQAALNVIPFVIVGIFASRGLVNFGQSYLTAYVGMHIVTDVRNAINRHLQSLSLSFFHRHSTGTLISRVNNDVTMLRTAVTDSVASLMRDTTSVVVLTAVAFYMDWVLASIAFVVFPASVLPVTRLSRKIKRFTKRGLVAKGNLTAFLQESIQGNRIVKAFGMEEYENKRFGQENQRILKQALRASRIRSVVTPAMELLASFGIAAVVWYGGSSVIQEGRTQGEFMAFITAMVLMYQPFKNLTRMFTAVQQGIAAAERVFEILDAEPEIQDHPNAVPSPRLSRGIELHNVSFGYGRNSVLNNINLKVEAGEMVALVGVSGVGKSTLADLVPRFYDVTVGKITIDGVDIREVTLQSLRSQIGIVAQRTFLFNDTVRNNIAYGDPSKDTESIVAAAKAIPNDAKSSMAGVTTARMRLALKACLRIRSFS